MNEWNEAVDHNTGCSKPYYLQTLCGFFYIPLGCTNKSEGLWDGTYGSYSLWKKTWKSPLLRQHLLLSYFKTLSAGPAGFKLMISCMAAQCLTNWATWVCSVMVVVIQVTKVDCAVLPFQQKPVSQSWTEDITFHRSKQTFGSFTAKLQYIENMVDSRYCT